MLKEARGRARHFRMLLRFRQFVAALIMDQPQRPDIPHLFPRGDYTLPVATWATSILGLDDIESCLLLEVQHCKCEKEKQHEFLIVKIRHPTNHTAVLCTDRSPKPMERRSDISGEKLDGVSLISSAQVPANDRVMLSRNGEDVKLTKIFQPFQRLQSMSFPGSTGPTVTQFAVLVSVVSAHTPNYDLYESQCYWFAGVTWDALRDLFGGHVQAASTNLRRSSYLGLTIPRAHSSSFIADEYERSWSDVKTMMARKKQEREGREQEV